MTSTGWKSLDQRRHLALWVAREVMPCERNVRNWLASKRVSPDEVDEIVQEAYCRLSMLDQVTHIDKPKVYFFSIVRNLLTRRLKRQRVVPFETIAEIESYHDDGPSPERITAGRLDYARVSEFIAELPDRCRRVVQLRKVEGWSQKQIAEHMGMTEKAVEKQIWLGVNALRVAWARTEEAAATRFDNGLARNEAER